MDEFKAMIVLFAWLKRYSLYVHIILLLSLLEIFVLVNNLKRHMHFYTVIPILINN